MIKPRVITYAQNREDIILSGFFDMSKKGFYIDVGANDPVEDSVTKFFYDQGWSGVNFEPVKKHYKQLLADRPRDINLNIGISDKPGSLKFREYKNTGLSTFASGMKNEYGDEDLKYTGGHTDYEVQVRTLKSVFEELNIKKIHFMKVDVEGLEYEALAGNDWKKYRPMVICIEANHVLKDWRALLIKNKYKLAFFDNLNEYYYDITAAKELKEFSFIETVLFQEPIVHYRLLEDFKEYDKLVAWLDEDKKILTEKLRVSDKRVADLEAHLEEIGSLKRHIKRYVKERARAVDRVASERLNKKPPFRPLEINTNSASKTKLLQDINSNDRANFKKYTDMSAETRAHKTYSKAKKMVRKPARKIRGN